MTRALIAVLSGLLVSSIATSACSPSADDDGPTDCPSGKCDGLLDAPDDEIEDSACDGVIFDLSGRRNDKVIGRLGDPIAKALHAAENCPTNFRELNEILDDALGTDCITRTRVISEQGSTIASFGTVANAASKASYRTVTNRRCGDDGTDHDALFSQFGMGSTSAAPDDFEAISFDEVEGVFNYYKLHDDGSFAWFGNSKDFLDGRGQEVTIVDTVTAEKNCAGCHVGGGLIMKELPAPWLHWHQGPLAGADELVERNEDLFGTLATGANLENVVKRGNSKWNPKRVEHMLANTTVEDLLRPIFCTTEVNLDSAGEGLQSPIDGQIGFISFDVGATEYISIRDENEQTMITGADSSTTGPDTDDLAGKIANGFIDNIGANATGAARELRRNLLNFDGDDNGRSAVDTFEEACNDRDPLELARDAMTVNSLLRSNAREMEIMEFSGTLAFDKFEPEFGAGSSINAKSRLSPKSCELVTRFTAVATPADDE